MYLHYIIVHAVAKAYTVYTAYLCMYLYLVGLNLTKGSSARNMLTPFALIELLHVIYMYMHTYIHVDYIVYVHSTGIQWVFQVHVRVHTKYMYTCTYMLHTLNFTSTCTCTCICLGKAESEGRRGPSE